MAQGSERRSQEIRYGDPGGWYVRLFSLYVHFYLRRHFHGVRIATDGAPPELAGPLVVYLNHPSWWDPLMAMTLGKRYFPDRRHVAFIDAEMAERYSVLRPLGLVGIEDGAAGARRFLRVARQALAEQDTVLWLTPQGRFVDPRDRSVPLAAGLARLARLAPGAHFLPLALEYPFWDERTPEALARFGAAMGAAEATDPAALERRLAETQDRLATDAVARDEGRFAQLLSGQAGVGGIYDLWRRVRAVFGGPAFEAEHSVRRSRSDGEELASGDGSGSTPGLRHEVGP